MLDISRHIETLIQELVVLVQRSEEYSAFMTARMKDAVTAEVQQHDAAAAASTLSPRASSLQRLRSSVQAPTDTPRATGRETATAAGRHKRSIDVAFHMKA